MKFSDFVVKEAIVPELRASDRDGVIRELVAALAAQGAVPKAAVEAIVGAVVEREKNGTTGFGKGVAVPHAKHARLKRMVATVGRSVGGIDFSALDNQPVHIVVLLLSPGTAPNHLPAMNTIFTNLQNDMFRRFMREAGTQAAIAELLDEADQGK